MTKIDSKQNKIIYCHFQFKRRKGKDYGLFAVQLYKDFEGREQLGHTTKRQILWQNHQFITAIQSYSFALDVISQIQGRMKNLGITQVMLVTDNSTLAGWIVNPKKNKKYTEWMDKAVEPYRMGSPKEIVVGIGLCEARDYEKSYKYCKEELAINTADSLVEHENKGGANRIQIDEGYKSAFDILRESGEIF